MIQRELAIIKGDKEGLSLLIDQDAHITSVAHKLREKLQNSATFFRGASLQLQPQKRQLTADERSLLQQTVADFGMQLIDAPTKSAHNGSEQETESVAEATQQTKQNETHQHTNINEGNASGMDHEEEAHTLLIKRTLRSGQSVSFDGNVVIRGDVNPGAMVTCTGDIIVLGALRGVAHAGAAGNTSSEVIAFQLQPTQLRIAGAISRAPDEQTHVPTGPEVARVQDGAIEIAAYKP